LKNDADRIKRFSAQVNVGRILEWMDVVMKVYVEQATLDARSNETAE
jgi:hypothetical protein